MARNSNSILISLLIEDLRKIFSDLEILATKKIIPDKKMIQFLGNPEITEREITIDGIVYSVRDYALDERNSKRKICVAHVKYNSQELRPTPSD